MFPETDIVCSGKSVSLNVRAKSDLSKRILRQLYKPIVDHGHQHEIANNYRDFRLMKNNRYRRKSKRLSYAPRNFSPVPREILQIPSLIFPRLGTNFSWRGRQTLCQLPKSNHIESEKLLNIRAASSLQDFQRLFSSHQNDTSFQRDDHCLNQFHIHHPTQVSSTKSISCSRQASQRHPVTNNRQHIAKATATTDDDTDDDYDSVPPAPVTSPATSPQYHRQGQPHRRQSFLRTIAVGRAGGGGTTTAEEGNDDNAENLEWYIQLASRCYTEGFLWHMNYLSGCSERQSALLQQRRQRQPSSRRVSLSKWCDKATAKHCNSIAAEHNVNPNAIQNIYARNYDSDATEDNNDNCKISININKTHIGNNGRHQYHQTHQPTPAYASRPNTTNQQPVNERSYHIMNDNDNNSGRVIDAINNNNKNHSSQHYNQRRQNLDVKLNQVIDNFCTLNISCDAGAYLLPQIILTDFSAVKSEQPKSTTLLVSQQQQQQQPIVGASANNISCERSITPQSINSNHSIATTASSSLPRLSTLLALSIPSDADAYVGGESRPP